MIKLSKNEKESLYLLFNMMSVCSKKMFNKLLSKDTLIDLSVKDKKDINLVIDSYLDPLINKEMKEDGCKWDYIIDKKILLRIKNKC